MKKTIEQSSKYVGRFEDEKFKHDVFAEIIEGTIQSPIERVLYVALLAVMRINFLGGVEPESDTLLSPGIYIAPQKKIGKYRADFSIECIRWRHEKMTPSHYTFREVVVECDGTAFHERTEVERRAEKCRDRFMQKMGLKVFRYTGKEILDDPYTIAAEIIGYVTDDEENTLTPKQYFA